MILILCEIGVLDLQIRLKVSVEVLVLTVLLHTYSFKGFDVCCATLYCSSYIYGN